MGYTKEELMAALASAAKFMAKDSAHCALRKEVYPRCSDCPGNTRGGWECVTAIMNYFLKGKADKED